MQSGVQKKEEISSNRRKRDVRTFLERYRDYCSNADTAIIFLVIMIVVTITFCFILRIPFAAEILCVYYFLGTKKYFNFKKRAFNFPYRVPIQAHVNDASYSKPKKGQGITCLGNERETQLPIYLSDSDLRTHLLVLGTTGSGKTIFLLGLCANALIQNTGFLFNDGKGDAQLPKDLFRLARALGREDDFLIINFITSGRDFLEKQEDKITNNINLMANASSGMLVETIVGLMDGAAGGDGGGDMWKGRAIAFITALTRPLCYLRDKGLIRLSSETYLHYFQLENLETLIFEPGSLFENTNFNKEDFDKVNGALQDYVFNLPGYNKNLYANKKRQDQKTLEQHGYITMQLMRIFNDLTYNYAHIFKTEVGDIDFFDVVLNRRIAAVLLPSSERSPDSLKMLGKLILGNMKQMIAGCLGNKVEGQVRSIIENRPTNSPTPFYSINDEYGYYSVEGFANLAAQSRSTGVSITFAAQDFASLKRTNAQEADSTWENTNLRAVGRITSGTESETWRRISGASGSAHVTNLSSFDRNIGVIDEKLTTPNSLGVTRQDRLDYDDLASQEMGEFTYIIGKKEDQGRQERVSVIRGYSLYASSDEPKATRINDFIPVLLPEKKDIVSVDKQIDSVKCKLETAGISQILTSEDYCKSIVPLNAINAMYEFMNQEKRQISRPKQTLAILYWLKTKFDQPTEFGINVGGLLNSVNKIDSQKIHTIKIFFDDVVNQIIKSSESQKEEDRESFEQQDISSSIEIATEEEEIHVDSLLEIYDDSLLSNQDIKIDINSINVIDPIIDYNDDPYSILDQVNLFKYQNEDAESEFVSENQINEIHQLMELSQNPKSSYKLITDAIKQNTTYSKPKNLPDTNLLEADSIIKELLENTEKLKTKTIQNIKKIYN